MDIRSGTTLEGPNGQTITIDALLGRGGFGQVFSGTMSDGTRVAVKTVLTASLDDDELRSLQNEARYAIGIQHPNVTRLLYVNDGEATQGRSPYLVLEYVNGGTLRAVLDGHQSTGTKISVDELQAMFLQIAEGMEAVNARIVHRDLKPENVLFDTSHGLLKIADFGLAKLADAATRSETFKGWGTRPYQAPEAFDNGPNTISMDIYAAGVMFYEMATLTWPVQPKPGDNGPLAWRNAHLLTPPKDIRTLRSDLPASLVQIITQMLQKDPARRPASWTSIIERFKDGQREGGGPDVTALVNKATATFIQVTEKEMRAREERERQVERNAVLEQAFNDPMDILRNLVEAFNASSDVGKLTFRASGKLSAEVTNTSGGRLILTSELIDDLDIRPDGIVRIVGTAHLNPEPAMSTIHDSPSSDSFGGFSLVYRVSDTTNRYGDWTQFRFELNPLVRRGGYPRWFAIGGNSLRRELKILHAVGRHQHEARSLDDEWFKALLLQMV